MRVTELEGPHREFQVAQAYQILSILGFIQEAENQEGPITRAISIPNTQL